MTVFSVCDERAREREKEKNYTNLTIYIFPNSHIHMLLVVNSKSHP